MTAADDGDEATFDDVTETDMALYVAITLNIRLEVYDFVNNDISIMCGVFIKKI